MKKNVIKAMNSLEKLEKKIMNNEKQESAIKSKIYDKIPSTLCNTLEAAFIKAFEIVFQHGTAIIEKTFDKEDITFEYDANNYVLDKKDTQKNLKRLDKVAKKSNFINNTFATASGMGMGILGFGIPDIPIFVSTILKGMYQIALSYGFSYESIEEKIYILRLIKVALADSNLKMLYNMQLDNMQQGNMQQGNMQSNNEKLGNMQSDNDNMQSDKIQYNELDLKQEIVATAKVLSEALLVEKFIQGIPIVGIVGGITNHMVYKKISKFTTLKYKKRYLLQKLVQ